MAPVTRLAALRAATVARRERLVSRARRGLLDGERASSRLNGRRMAVMAAFCASDGRRAARFNRRMAGYVWERIGTMAQDGSDVRFGRQMVRLMTRFPEVVDASPQMRRVLHATRIMNRADGASQRRVAAVYRRLGSTGYYTL